MPKFPKNHQRAHCDKKTHLFPGRVRSHKQVVYPLLQKQYRTRTQQTVSDNSSAKAAAGAVFGAEIRNTNDQQVPDLHGIPQYNELPHLLQNRRPALQLAARRNIGTDFHHVLHSSRFRSAQQQPPDISEPRIADHVLSSFQTAGQNFSFHLFFLFSYATPDQRHHQNFAFTYHELHLGTT